MTRQTAQRILLGAATLCFLVAWFLTAGWFISGSNPSAWGYAGLSALALAFLA